MKSTLLALALITSFSAFARTSASQGINNLIPSGKYQGTNEAGTCLASIETNNDTATVTIRTASTSLGYTVVNSAPNYHVNASTSEVSATQSLKSPFYISGATKFLTVRSNSANQVQLSIAIISMDHRGNDSSTDVSCTISL